MTYEKAVGSTTAFLMLKLGQKWAFPVHLLLLERWTWLLIIFEETISNQL